MKIINEIEEDKKKRLIESEFLAFLIDELKLNKLYKLYYRYSPYCDYYKIYRSVTWFSGEHLIAKFNFGRGEIDIVLYGDCYLNQFKQAIQEWEKLHKGQEITLIITKGDC